MPSAPRTSWRTWYSTSVGTRVGVHFAPRSLDVHTPWPAAIHVPGAPGTPTSAVIGAPRLPGRVHVAPPSCDANTQPVSVTASICRPSAGWAAAWVIAGTASGSLSDSDVKVLPLSVEIHRPVVRDVRNTVFLACGCTTTPCGSRSAWSGPSHFVRFSVRKRPWPSITA